MVCLRLRSQQSPLTLHVPLLCGHDHGVVREGVPGPRREHSWSMLHLPRYQAVMQADTIATAAQVGPLPVAHRRAATLQGRPWFPCTCYRKC